MNRARLIARLVLATSIIVGYEVWAADAMGLPRLTPGYHPLLGDWQDEARDYERFVTFRRDHSGLLRIIPDDEHLDGIEISFSWTTRQETRTKRSGHVQISYIRDNQNTESRDNISAPCRFEVTPWRTEEESGRDLSLEGGRGCEIFLGDYQ